MSSTSRPAAVHGGLTPARVAALLLIAALAGGLLLARLTRGSDRVAVPDHARAGQLELHGCDYRGLPADCGTLVVAENRHRAGSRLIALPVTRVRARTKQPAAPLFRLEGGPGLTNMDFPWVRRFAGSRDVVLVGYRGVDGSTRLDCPEVSGAMARQRDLLGAAYQAAAGRAFRDCAARLRRSGVDLAGYSLPERADDLEAARRALGYDRIDLLSESAGTRTAMIYAWRHPQAVHRSVMVGVNPPGRFVWDGATTDAQLRRYTRRCAQAAGCRLRAAGLAGTLRDDVPGHWGPFPVRDGNARLATFFGLMDTTTASALPAPATVDSWLAARDGDPAGLWLLSLLPSLVFPEAQVWGDVAAVGRADAAAARRAFASGAGRDSALRGAGTRFLLAGGALPDAWPAGPDDDAYAQVPDSATETLLVGGELDVATPPQHATRDLLPHLSRGHQVVLPGLGHTGDFWAVQPAASTHLITTFLDAGRVDAARYRPRTLDADVALGQVGIARIVAGTMLGLPLLAALALAGVLARVRRRGRLTLRGAFAVRALLAPVAGLAGWLLAVVLGQVTRASVAADAPLLVVAAVALPVALTALLGWTDRARERRARRTALVAAAGAALVGAWLGAGVGAAALAPLAAVAGAVLAVNLALIGLDVAAGRAVPAPPERRAAQLVG